MKPSIFVGIIFGLINLSTNIFVILPTKEKNIGLILGSGLLFFNSLFSVLFTKKSNGYQLTLAEGLKSSIQSGIIHGLFYFVSIVVIQNFILKGFFPELVTFKQYFFILNINIIIFSIFSTIFGFITSALLYTKKT